MAKSGKTSVGRRNFLKGAAAGAAVLATPVASAQQTAQQPAPARPGTLPPTAAQRAAETANVSVEDIQIVERPGSDYMVDVFKSLGFEYLFATPGSSFRGIHESVINHGGNRAPRVHHLYA
jgi:hypothetical protein